MKTNPFWLFTAAIFILLILPGLLAQGMFMDGMLYSCVARNMSEGIGTFWEPIFSTSWIKNGNPAFHEHPPLVFGLQGIYFLIFGDHSYVERLYALSTAVGTAWLIICIWRLVLVHYKKYIHLGWLPILCWIIIPVGFWSYQNNLQENTLGLFTTLAVYCTLLSFIRGSRPSLALAGLSIFAATLSKGLPGLFPLVAPFLWWICTRKISFGRMMESTFVLAAVPAMSYLMLSFYEPAATSLQFYLEHRVLGRIETSPTVAHRFYIVGRFFQEILPILILAVITFGLAKWKNIDLFPRFHFGPLVWFFLSLGLGGILPLLLTKVQKGFYMVPAFPLIGIGFALLMMEPWRQLTKYLKHNKKLHRQLQLASIALCLFVTLYALSRIPTFKKDQQLIHQIRVLGNHIPAHSTIQIDPTLHTEWALHTYFMRYFHISLDKGETPRRFYLSPKEEAPQGYLPLPSIKTNKYFLFQHIGT